MKKVMIFLCFLPIMACTQQNMKILSEKETEITVKVGEQFSIQLESKIGTGYKWMLSEQPDSNLITLVSQEYKSKSSADGGLGKDVFIFQAKNKGRLELKLWYIRPWEKDKVVPDNVTKKIYMIKVE